jgi:hypothetical protein
LESNAAAASEYTQEIDGPPRRQIVREDGFRLFHLILVQNKAAAGI